MLGNNEEIKTTALLDTGVTGYLFIDPSIVRRVCVELQIEPIRLSKPKAIRGFDGKQASNITYAIYPTMTIQDHKETTTPMLITKLGQHQIILGKPWMKKHGAVLDMRNDRLIFWPGHYQHDVALRPCVDLEGPHAEKPRAEKPHASRPTEILKRLLSKLPELLPYRLPSTQGVSKVTSPLEKKSTPPRPETKRTDEVKDKTKAKGEAKVKNKESSVERADNPLDLAFIGGALFMHLAKKQKAEVFAISMRDIEYQLNKGAKPVIDPKIVVPAEYHDLIDVFSKDVSNTLRPYGKYDHKIELLKDKDLASDLGHSPLRGMSTPQLKFVKKFLEEHLKKKFIEASNAPCSSPILLAKKPGGGIRFCVDYRKLNSLTKKDAYPLPLIAETMARLKKAIVFTKIDIRQAFHKLCMAIESEDATTLASRFGAYKWKVMSFGLTGGPASWQRFFNNLLWEYLNDFCTAYLDDILIYSTSMKKHRQHVRKVLTKLQEAGISADVDKCKFHVIKTKYLGLIVSTAEIRMALAKVDAIKRWDTPTCVKEVQSFIGFCNFYCQFIKNFSNIAGPLNTLTKKDVKFSWAEECDVAFKKLKQRVCEAPILIYFNPSKECHVETDSSDYVSAGVLSQEDDNGILHPVVYFSKRMVPAECNFEIYNKELLAIIRCFEEWRPELEGTAMPVKVLTDHKGLEYFMTTKKLTPRQARWAKFLSEFNFTVNYQSGKRNDKADALTRKPNERLISNDNKRQEHRMQVLLPPERVSIQPIEVSNKPAYEHKAEPHAESNTENEEINKDLPTLPDRVKASNRTNVLFEEVREYLENLIGRDRPNVYLRDSRAENGLLYKDNKLWVANDLRLDVIREVHDQLAVGHAGVRRTILLIQQHYFWPKMKRDVSQYIWNCHVCRQAKAPQDRYNETLKPLPVPQRPWTNITMNFVTGLPECDLKNAILMVVDRLAKERVYIPCSNKDERGTNAEATAKMLLHNVWQRHGLLSSVVSDRGPQFVSAV